MSGDFLCQVTSLQISLQGGGGCVWVMLLLGGGGGVGGQAQYKLSYRGNLQQPVIEFNVVLTEGQLSAKYPSQTFQMIHWLNT